MHLSQNINTNHFIKLSWELEVTLIKDKIIHAGYANVLHGMELLAFVAVVERIVVLLLEHLYQLVYSAYVLDAIVIALDNKQDV